MERKHDFYYRLTKRRLPYISRTIFHNRGLVIYVKARASKAKATSQGQHPW